MNTEEWFCLKEIIVQVRLSAKPGSDKPVLSVVCLSECKLVLHPSLVPTVQNWFYGANEGGQYLLVCSCHEADLFRRKLSPPSWPRFKVLLCNLECHLRFFFIARALITLGSLKGRTHEDKGVRSVWMG